MQVNGLLDFTYYDIEAIFSSGNEILVSKISELDEKNHVKKQLFIFDENIRKIYFNGNFKLMSSFEIYKNDLNEYATKKNLTVDEKYKLPFFPRTKNSISLLHAPT